LETVHSITGHDAFLIEDKLTGEIVRRALST
jgi:homoserine acetyltransferase